MYIQTFSTIENIYCCLFTKKINLFTCFTGQDSGRCPVCGKMFHWKLLNHVAKDHSKTLKPAHLSYKCTVCTATFGQYKLFETHVYSAHSGG